MALKALHPCNRAGCHNLTRERYCDKHAAEAVAETPRESSSKRGYGYRWQVESKQYLAAHPWCAQCEREGRTTAAVLVDHKTPHKGDKHLFWNKSNWQGLCWSCHSKKTAKEDGGYKNKVKKH